ncbi:helix-turn-helix domain-containing protein [Frankia sp. AgKG'84/4]|uniref:helix-turn-helix domain-containing protein n=1 Tax=Frankia sp. AgKG'84/4 TaxID=573490 RepID=UPI00202AA28A|nr:helix-turn-helix domain-containing protein [Frankia sp. AgKG'84/4]MCL9793692.1 helix-turn-helix domain-containing protein [Frankia sp. AgKG'84/4]
MRATFGDMPGERLTLRAAASRPRPADARITPRQVAHWRRTGLVRGGSRELADLRMIGALRRAGVSLGRIRAALDRGRGPARADAAADLARFAVYAGELYVRHPDGSWEGERRPGQLVLEGAVPLLPVPGAVMADALTAPTPDGRAPRLGGTRAARPGSRSSTPIPSPPIPSPPIPSDLTLPEPAGVHIARPHLAGSSRVDSAEAGSARGGPGRTTLPGDVAAIHRFLARQNAGPAPETGARVQAELPRADGPAAPPTGRSEGT